MCIKAKLLPQSRYITPQNFLVPLCNFFFFPALLVLSIPQVRIVEGTGTPTPVLLPRKSHGWRSLVGCSAWGR